MAVFKRKNLKIMNKPTNKIEQFQLVVKTNLKAGASVRPPKEICQTSKGVTYCMVPGKGIVKK